MNKMVVTIAIMISALCYAQDTGQISVKMSDEVKEIASVADKWHEAWKNNDKKTFLELMRPDDPKLPDKILELGKQLFAYLEDRPHKCLIVSRTELVSRTGQKLSFAKVYLYPISLPGRQIGFEMAMSKQDGKWYVLAAGGIGINELVTHYQRWADEYEKYEIWYDTNAPEWLKPGQRESELSKKIAEIKVKDRKLYQDSYGHLFADISKELLAGSRLQRSQLLKVIRKKGLSRLFDESFVEPLKACLRSEDVEVVKLARDMYGPLKRKVREKLETDASKIPHSPEEFKVLADTYRKKVNELDKALAKYRSKEIFSDFLDVLENDVFPLVHKGRLAGEQEGTIYRQDPNAFKNSAFDEEESQPAIIDIVAAALKGIYEKFGRAVEEGDLRLPYDEQDRIFYWAGVQGFQSRQELIEKPYEEHCPFEQGTMEYYQFMDEVGRCCVMVSSPMMIMIKQLPEELEDAKEEVEIMYKWLETGKGSRGEAGMPELYKEPYLNEIDKLAVKESLYENKGK